ncbi:MAG: preprotein translocase subunit YajC [Phycisphaerales bacterium]|jgi:preprotein translocase subunit YajC|nr:preprotein translocase subunit YajC [Phycisphaerales bacterium]
MTLFTANVEVLHAVLTLQDQPAASGNPTGPAAPGQESEAVALVDGAPVVSDQGAVQDPFGGNFFLILMLFVLGMLVFSAFGGRKQRKKRASMLDSLKKHDQVVTRGGVFGSIVELKPDRVILKVDESSNTRITVVRESIEQVTNDSSE